MVSTMGSTRIAILVSLTVVACNAPKDEVSVTRGDDAGRPPDTPIAVAESRCLSRVLVGTGVGSLRIGLPVDSVAQLCSVVGDATVPADEGQLARKLTIAAGADTVVAEIVEAKVWRIEVTDADIRTSDSLGVGSTLGELLRISGARRIAGEGRVFVVSPTHCGLSFQLALSGAATAVSDLRRLPSETKVMRILAIGCSRER
jgi:hypothetical protein